MGKVNGYDAPVISETIMSGGLHWRAFDLICERTGKSNAQIAREIGVSNVSIMYWRRGIGVPHQTNQLKVYRWLKQIEESSHGA